MDWVVILDADQIIRGPIIPWELGAERGRPFAAHYGYGTLLTLIMNDLCNYFHCFSHTPLHN